MNTSFFETKEISDGVWAAISTNPTWMMANAGIVDLGNRTLVWDTGTSPRAAQELKRVAENLTSQTVELVVNSHHHLDHSFGNQVFTEANIFSTHKTRDLMQQRLARMLNEAKHFEAEIKNTEAELQSQTNPFFKRALELDLAELKMLQEILPTFNPTFPNITFEREMVFHGSNRNARVVSFGAGHTGSDSILVLEDGEIVFTGDLVVANSIGFMGHGDPEAWLTRITDLEELNASTIVPGHGPVSGPSVLPEMRQFLLEMIELSNVSSKADLAAVRVPKNWQNWDLPAAFKHNLNFLFEHKKN